MLAGKAACAHREEHEDELRRQSTHFRETLRRLRSELQEQSFQSGEALNTLKRKLQEQSFQSEETIRQLKAEIEHFKITRFESKRECHSIKASLSWRVTWPLRVLRDAGMAFIHKSQRRIRLLAADRPSSASDNINTHSVTNLLPPLDTSLGGKERQVQPGSVADRTPVRGRFIEFRSKQGNCASCFAPNLAHRRPHSCLEPSRRSPAEIQRDRSYPRGRGSWKGVSRRKQSNDRTTDRRTEVTVFPDSTFSRDFCARASQVCNRQFHRLRGDIERPVGKRYCDSALDSRRRWHRRGAPGMSPRQPPGPAGRSHHPGLAASLGHPGRRWCARSAAFTLAAVEVPGTAAGAVQRFAAAGDQVQGTFTAPAGAALHALPVRALGSNGEALVFAHRYRLHQVREGIAQRVVGTGTTRFFAVTVAPDGTVWAGGDGGGRLYQVAPGSTTAQFRRAAPGRPHGPGGRSGRGPARAPACRGLCAPEQWRRRPGAGRRVPDRQCRRSGLSPA